MPRVHRRAEYSGQFDIHAPLWKILRIFIRWVNGDLAYPLSDEQLSVISRRMYEETTEAQRHRHSFQPGWCRCIIHGHGLHFYSQSRYMPQGLTYLCDLCSHIFPIHLNTTPPQGHGHYCPDCANGRSFCESCGCILLRVEDEAHRRLPSFRVSTQSATHCMACYAAQSAIINPRHNANPITILAPRLVLDPKVLYQGVELEVEAGRCSPDRLAVELLPAFDRKAIFKHDGSLRNGFEICTLPLTLDEHAKLWEKVYANKVWGDLHADETASAGLHIHASRAPLTSLQIARLVHFMSKREQRREIEMVAGRAGNQYCQYEPMTVSRAGMKVRGHSDNGKYEVVNLLHRPSIEIRAFQSTKDYDKMMARLEFVQAVLWFCRQAKAVDLSWTNFCDWLSGVPQHKLFKHARSAVMAATKGIASLPPQMTFASWTALVTDRLSEASRLRYAVYSQCSDHTPDMRCRQCDNSMYEIEQNAGMYRPDELNLPH